MSIEFKIRKATNKDIPKVKDIIFTVLEEYGLVPDEFGIDSSLTDLELNYFNNGGLFGVLVSSSDEIIGTIGIVSIGNNVFELKKMFLKKEFRGKGFGKLMMNYILHYAKSCGCKKLELETIQVLQEAIGLYKSYGFKAIKPRVINNRVDQAYELNIEKP